MQKATELGVARLSPLLTRHSVIRLGAEQGRAKQARWQRIAQEAAKQCRRATVPLVEAPQPFEPFIRALARADDRAGHRAEGVVGEEAPGAVGGRRDLFILMPTLAVTAVPLSEVLKEHRTAREVLVLIGPEGDFSREEVALAQAGGARPVSLGALTLRTETAAVATLAILDYVFGRL